MINREQARRDFSRIGVALLVFVGLATGLGQLLSWGIVRIYGEQVLDIAWVMLLISAAVQYLVAMPAAFLILRGMQKQDVLPMRITFGRFMIIFLISYFLMYSGSLIGQGASALIQHFTDRTMNFFIDGLLTRENVLVYGLFVVILAPIAEELFFRKLLITRLEKYGEAPAIIVSGLLFGLIHGNLYQAFYAVAIGMVLGYVYIRTRKIFVTIGLHMLINLFGGVIIPLVAGSSFIAASILGLVILGVVISGLVMFIIRIKKITLIKRATALPTPGWGQYVFVNAGMIIFFVACLALFTLNTWNMLVPI